MKQVMQNTKYASITELRNHFKNEKRFDDVAVIFLFRYEERSLPRGRLRWERAKNMPQSFMEKNAIHLSMRSVIYMVPVICIIRIL